MALDTVRYVDKFPQTFQVNHSSEIELDIIGIQDFHIHDSLLILKTTDKDGFWAFLSLPNYDFLGKFITKGDGPYEHIFSPKIGDIFNEGENLFITVYDHQKAKSYKMNITESVISKELSISKLNDSLPRNTIFNFLRIDSATFFCKEINNSLTQQTRFILENGEEKTPPVLEKLNLASIKEHEDFNILATVILYDSDRKIIVEMPAGLNYINMYSLDGSLAKTICVGDKLDNIGRIQEKARWNRMYTFANLRLFENFWGVLHINESYVIYQTKRIKLPSIMLFDWNGEPLAELNLNRFITSFDIDFRNGYLYTLDVHTDEFYKYDIKDILMKLQQ
jgi:hypothetical protein